MTDRLAMDLASVRSRDENGYLRVAVSNISKAAVNGYLGSEIPNCEQLGLDPTRMYQLLRDPDELEKAAPTFNGVPILNRHIPVAAEKPPKEAIIGAFGTDAEFKKPFLRNSLVVWDASSIAGIETGDQREISCAYRYDPDMTPGTFQGAPYDGVMRNLRANHGAIVPDGRAGSDVVVGDSLSTEKRDDLDADKFAVPGKRKLPIENAKHVREAWDLLDDTDGLSAEEKATARRRILDAAKKFDIDTSGWNAHPGAMDSLFPIVKDMSHMTKVILSRKGALAKGALSVYLAPKMAQDAKLDFGAILKGVTAKNFKTEKPNIIARLTAATKDKLAQDATLDDVNLLLDKLDDTAGVDDDSGAVTVDDDPDMTGDADEEAMKAFLKDKLKPEDHAKFCEMLGKPAVVGDDPPPFPGQPKTGGKEEPITKQAMDAAIEASVKSAVSAAETATIARLSAAREAEREVVELIGKNNMAHHSAEGWFRGALDMLSVPHKDIKETAALRAVLHAQQKQTKRAPVMATDASAEKSFSTRYPNAARIKSV
jgi:hypothetical protein